MIARTEELNSPTIVRGDMKAHENCGRIGSHDEDIRRLGLDGLSISAIAREIGHPHSSDSVAKRVALLASEIKTLPHLITKLVDAFEEEKVLPKKVSANRLAQLRDHITIWLAENGYEGGY